MPTPLAHVPDTTLTLSPTLIVVTLAVLRFAFGSFFSVFDSAVAVICRGGIVAFTLDVS